MLHNKDTPVSMKSSSSVYKQLFSGSRILPPVPDLICGPQLVIYASICVRVLVRESVANCSFFQNTTQHSDYTPKNVLKVWSSNCFL
jgi:hypothetical protein